MIIVEEAVDTARQITSMPLLVPRSDASRAIGRSARRVRAVGFASPRPPYSAVAKISFVVLGEPA